MSSKADRRRRDHSEREERRRRAEELKKDWVCATCGHTVFSWSPICLCGSIRPVP